MSAVRRRPTWRRREVIGYTICTRASPLLARLLGYHCWRCRRWWKLR